MKRDAGHSPIPAAARDAAAGWVARVDGGLSAGERTEFELWLRADASHVAAFESLTSAWGRLDGPRLRGAGAAAESHLRDRQRRRTHRRVGASIAAAVVLTAAGWWGLPLRPTRSLGVENAPLEIASAPVSRLLTLEDGSVVELHRDAEIAPEFTPGVRRVRLLRGEAHFAVMKNRERPFIVDAGGVEVRAVGTAFAVRFTPAEVEVLVTEGRVAVGRPHGASTTADAFSPSSLAPVVPAGSRVLVRLQAQSVSAQVSSVAVEEIERRLSWRGTWLDFSGTRLADAVADVNRHSGGRLVIADPELAELRVSGLTRADRIDDFVRLLELFGVRAERLDDGRILLRAGR